MKVSTETANMKIKRWFHIDEDQPVVGMAYSRDGKKVRVIRGTIEYLWKDGQWVVDSEFSVDLVTVVLKKDGSDSLNTHARHADTKSYSGKENWTEEFAWIKPIVDLLRPTGELSLALLAEYEVDA